MNLKLILLIIVCNILPGLIYGQDENTSAISHKHAAVSWVDDDFDPRSHGLIKKICDEINIKCDFALIPNTTQDNQYYFEDSVLVYINQYEKEGFHFEMHPPHKGWYKSNFAGYYKGTLWVEESMKKTIEVFDKYKINHSNVIIYPGGSGSNPEVINIASSLFEYGVKATGDINCDKCSKFTFCRMFLNISPQKTKSYYKKIIKEAIDNGCWIILGTHGHGYINDFNTLDETSMSLPNLKELIEFTNKLCPIKSIRENYKCWYNN